MSKATEDKMNELHGKVATVLCEIVDHKSAPVTFDEEGNTIVGEEEFDVSPAMVSAATKFLKDNQITCDVEQDQNLSRLKDTLDKKRKHSLGDAKQAANTQH